MELLEHYVQQKHWPASDYSDLDIVLSHDTRASQHEQLRYYFHSTILLSLAFLSRFWVNQVPETNSFHFLQWWHQIREDTLLEHITNAQDCSAHKHESMSSIVQ